MHLGFGAYYLQWRKENFSHPNISQWESEIDITCLESDRLDQPFTHFT